MHEQYSDNTSAQDPLLDVDYEIEAFTEQEARVLFDEIARKFLGVSGDEFRKKWHRGDYDDAPDCFQVMTVAMSLPLVEREELT